MSQIQSQTTWELKKDKNMIQVFTREMEGYAGVKQLKAITTINTNLNELTNKLFDVESYHTWMANLKQAKKIKYSDSNDFYVYYEISTPWPTKNRDNIDKFEVIRDPVSNTVTIKVEGQPTVIEKKDGIIRMKKSEGFWKFQQLEEDKVELTYQYVADPGGKLPKWIINMFIVDGPYETLMNLKNLYP